MNKRLESANGTVTESAANTITNSQVEVPNSYGAKKVFVRSAELDPFEPDVVASGWSKTYAVACAGKQTPTSATLADQGAFTTKEKRLWCASTAPVVRATDGPDQYMGPRQIFPDQDGKFYVTIAVLGSGNSAAKNVRYNIEFMVYG